MSDIKTKMVAIIIRKAEGPKQNHYFIGMEEATKIILFGQLINLIASMFFGLYVFLLIEELYDKLFFPYGSSIQVIYPLVYTINIFFALFGPISCAAELVVCQIINSLTDLFGDWMEVLKCNSGIQQLNNDGIAQEENCAQSAVQMDVEHETM